VGVADLKQLAPPELAAVPFEPEVFSKATLPLSLSQTFMKTADVELTFPCSDTFRGPTAGPLPVAFHHCPG